MAPIGFGIVGCGMIANFHAEAIRQIQGARIVGCFDKHADRTARFAAANPGVTAFPNLDQMLADSRVHVVTICTPSGAHRESAVTAAEAKKHVVVEKPMEITLKRCDDMLRACRVNNVLLCPIFPSRFSPANVAIKNAIDQGRFGRLTLGDTYVKWWRTQQYYDQGGWRGTWALDGGGAYMNQAIHNIDLLQWFMGDVTEVCAITATLAHERIEVEDVGVAAIKFKNGAIGTIEATTAAWPGHLKRTEIHGTTGSAIVEQDDLLLWQFEKAKPKDKLIREKFAKTIGGSGGASDPQAISCSGHRKQLKDFVTAIQTGSTPQISGDEGRKAVEIILAIYQAARSGRKVQIPLAGQSKRTTK